MDSALTRFLSRGLRFATSKVATTYVGLRTLIDPITSFYLNLPTTLPTSTQSVTVDPAGNVSYVALGPQIVRLLFTNASLTNGLLTVNHTLGEKFNIIQIYDENDKIIMTVDDITAISPTSFSADLASFGPIIGNWSLVAIG